MARTLSGIMSSVLGGLRRVTLSRAPSRPARSGPSDSSRSSGVGPPRSNGQRSAPATDSTLAGVTMVYSPDLDGDADPGEVVWTWVPWEEDPTQGKDRPVAIIGRRGSMLVGVPLTSKPHDNELQVPIGTGPWDREGRTSYAKLERILEVDPAQIRREGAVLGRRQFDDIVAALRLR